MCCEVLLFGDMTGAGGGAEEALRARVQCAWGKFRELSPILTSRGASSEDDGFMDVWSDSKG